MELIHLNNPQMFESLGVTGIMNYKPLDRECRRIVFSVVEVESFGMSVAFHSLEKHLKAKVILNGGRRNELEKLIQCEVKL